MAATAAAPAAANSPTPRTPQSSRPLLATVEAAAKGTRTTSAGSTTAGLASHSHSRRSVNLRASTMRRTYRPPRSRSRCATRTAARSASSGIAATRPRIAARSTMAASSARPANSTSFSRPATSFESTASLGSRHQPVAWRVLVVAQRHQPVLPAEREHGEAGPHAAGVVAEGAVEGRQLADRAVDVVGELGPVPRPQVGLLRDEHRRGRVGAEASTDWLPITTRCSSLLIAAAVRARRRARGASRRGRLFRVQPQPLPLPGGGPGVAHDPLPLAVGDHAREGRVLPQLPRRLVVTLKHSEQPGPRPAAPPATGPRNADPACRAPRRGQRRQARCPCATDRPAPPPPPAGAARG